MESFFHPFVLLPSPFYRNRTVGAKLPSATVQAQINHKPLNPLHPNSPMDPPSSTSKSNKRPSQSQSHSHSHSQTPRPDPPTSSAAKKPRPNHTHPTKPSHKDSHSSKSSSNRDVVKASHILIKHQGSRRKASWRDPEGVVISATTRSDAVERLRKIREEIEAGTIRFADAANENSDCSSYKRGGDLGPFGRGKMQKPFEDAAFALKVGEMSDIIDTDSGVHIILRTA